MEHYGGGVGHDPGAIKSELIRSGLALETATTKKIVDTTKLGRDKYLSVAIFGSWDKLRYGKLCEDLGNDFTKGNNNFPVLVTNAYNIIMNYKQTRTSGHLFNDSEGVALITVEKSKTPMINKTRIKCHNCQKMGHYSNECPEKERKCRGRRGRQGGGHGSLTINDGG
jgi:hypothetical protein